MSSDVDVWSKNGYIFRRSWNTVNYERMITFKTAVETVQGFGCLGRSMLMGLTVTEQSGERHTLGVDSSALDENTWSFYASDCEKFMEMEPVLSFSDTMIVGITVSHDDDNIYGVSFLVEPKGFKGWRTTMAPTTEAPRMSAVVTPRPTISRTN